MIESIIFNIKKELKQRNKSIEWICKELRTNRNYINQLKDRTPVSKLKNIADAIGCSLSDLFVGV